MIAEQDQTKTALAKKEKLEKEIAKQGGIIEDGLYHGGRRVRAYHGHHGYMKSINGWILCPTETDLIKALGTDVIKSSINPNDLRKKFGLVFRKEIAPAEVLIKEYDYIETKRIDKWGQDTKLYVDRRTLYEKYFKSASFVDLILFTVLFPIIISYFLGSMISNQLTSNTNQIFSLIGVICIFILQGIIIENFWLSIITFLSGGAFFIPSIINTQKESI